VPGSPARHSVSFPDDAAILTVPKDFAAHVLAGEIDEDPRVSSSTLLVFARNFYLQWFEEEYRVEVTGFNEASRERARRIEESVSSDRDASARLLVSHYLTLAEVLDERAETSEQLDPDETRAEIFDGVHELVKRISTWANGRGLINLGREAGKTYEQLGRAIDVLV
jgi:hypothetical protein